jgi:hypothetical protein
MNQGVIGFAYSKNLTNVHLMNNGNYPDYGALGYKP